MTSPRSVLTEALASIFSGADETDADALLDHLADMGHIICPDPAGFLPAGSAAAGGSEPSPGGTGHTPAGSSLRSPAGDLSQRGTLAGAAATAGQVEPTPAGSLAGAPFGGRTLCAHSEVDGEGAHWMEPGEVCTYDLARRVLQW